MASVQVKSISALIVAVAQSLEAKTPGGSITDAVLSAYLAAYNDSSTEVRDWLVSKVARLNGALFEKAHQSLNPEDKGRLIAAGKQSDAANPAGKDVAATAWFLDAERELKTKSAAAPEVLTAYREAATRGMGKAADWLCANVIARSA